MVVRKILYILKWMLYLFCVAECFLSSISMKSGDLLSLVVFLCHTCAMEMPYIGFESLLCLFLGYQSKSVKMGGQQHTA